MISRYLGNKTSILPPILDAISSYARPGDHVVDAFSGSLSVSMGLKTAGYRVTGNDINLFSSVLGEAYLVPTELPEIRIGEILSPEIAADATSRAISRAEQILAEAEYADINEAIHRDRFVSLLMLLDFLNNCDSADLPEKYRRSDFFDAYCEAGARSNFVSSRGRSGNRRFFTPSNAVRIDGVLNHLRFWNLQEIVVGPTLAILLAITLRAIERVANTQGTYHDFPRSGWDSRALHPLKLDPPDLHLIYSGRLRHRVGREEDTLEFIETVDHHSVLYLDPPYNFRQYSAYYFLLNVVCRYVEMERPDEYFDKLQYVRGQNPEDDFASSFCKASRFIDDMRTLILRADCDAVVISYFDGRNHWSKFDAGPSSKGQRLLEELLSEPMFERGSQSTLQVSRRNYASYGGYTAREVSELILSARVVQDEERESRGAVRQSVPELV